MDCESPPANTDGRQQTSHSTLSISNSSLISGEILRGETRVGIKEGWNGISNQGEKVSEQEVYVTIFETTDFLDENHFYVGKLILVQ